MTDTTRQHAIPLDQTQVSLTASVLHQAAVDCRATGATSRSRSDRSAGTLGHLAARWASIAEREQHCDVVNIHGERLYNVPLTTEEWYHVRAALAEFAARFIRVTGDSPAAHVDRLRARRALLLSDRITEALTRD
ncbi:hypothetical protein AB0O01_35010 [Streptomyces sp. NPDC093252]|uniref:hypothetical protein n=1 Tax=Streptomyces sp. NPDC093252 TaxID=3154980 RepID=UPI003447FF84